ncbi:MAG: adenylate/guanylate cyclase domain-containing protein [bacterium]
MQCKQCERDNPVDANFCLQCGAPMASVCPKCGKELPADAAFCIACGHDLSKPLASPESTAPAQFPELAAPDGERRQATVLFSDLSGYTAMNERLDPEEVESIMSGIKAKAVGIVEAYGGIVTQFVGDEVLALFGIPVAHKDDPARAVRAALELHKMVRGLSPGIESRLGRPVRLHSGINTGLIVTNRKDDRDGRIGITGDTVNTGSRLKGLAADDAILVSAETRRWISDHFSMEALPPAALKGKGEPVASFRIVKEARGGLKALLRFTGRQAEIRQFQGAMEACLESGRGQTILVRGEPGIGKSRLAGEFLRIAADQAFATHTGLVLDFGAGKGRDAIRGLVHSLVALSPGAGLEKRQAAVKHALHMASIELEQEALLNDLLDVAQPEGLRVIYDAMRNETRIRRKQETVSRLVKTLTERQPVLLIVEDIHWADGLTVAYLAELAATVAECRGLLVMTTRIEGDPLDRTWRQAARGSSLMTIDLGPLRNEEALAMAGMYLEVPARTAQRCVDRAEGNPLFLEQLLLGVKETTEDGAESIPGSVQSIVLARLDNLTPQDRQALQAASVLGQRFDLEALRHLIQAPDYDCRELVALALLRPEERDYLFSHALVRQCIYDSLLIARRKALHTAAAEWFAEVDPGLRAEHLDAAEHPSAAQAYLEAARTQAAEFHFERALHHAERGLALAGEKVTQLELACLQGQLLREMGKIAASIEAFRNGLQFAEDSAGRCRVWIGLAAGMRILDQYDDALEALDKAGRAAKTLGLTLELAQLHHLRGNIYFPLGNIDGCLEEHQKALDHAQQARSLEYEARALGGLGDAQYMRGRVRTAHGHFRRCVEVCREHGLGNVEVANLHMVGWTGVYLNQLEQSMEQGLAAVEMAAKVSNQRAELLACRLVALINIEFLGDFKAAGEHLARGEALARNLKAKRFESQFFLFRAGIYLAERNRSDALPFVEQALEICRVIGMNFVGPWVYGALALITDDPVERQRALNEGEKILQGECVSHNYFFFYRDAIEVALDAGDWNEAERYAAALEDYTRPEPLPWSDFFIARGRALTASGRGERNGDTLRQLKGLRGEAGRVGFKLAQRALDEALAAG